MISHVCMMIGFLTSGRRVRAVCSCGYRTSPRVDQRRAVAALQEEHGYTRPVCQLCGREYQVTPWMQLTRDLEIFTDPDTGEQFLACRDVPQACQDGASQRQAQLDRVAADAFGVPELGRPQLRIVGGTDQERR